MPEKEFAFLIVVLTGKINIPALDYIAYILSAYALIICVTAILKIINFVRNGVSEHPFMKWLLSVPIVEKIIHEKNSEQKWPCIRDFSLMYYMLYLRQQQEFITGRVS